MSTKRNATALDSRLYVVSAEKCLTVLMAFRESAKPLSLREIAALSKMSASSAQRFVYTLKALGFLQQEEQTKRYFPSAQVLDLSHGFLVGSKLREFSLPYLREAHRLVGESVSLVQRDGNGVIYISRISSQQSPAIEMEYGSRLPLYCSGSGRVILAQLDRQRAEALLASSERPQRTPYTITDINEILDLLPAIREQGYAVNNQECFSGDLSLAAPIFDSHREPIAAINISLSAVRWELQEAKARCVPVIVEIAASISRMLRGI